MAFNPDQWLQQNQQHIDAATSSADQAPSEIEDYGQAAIQGAVLDPLEKVGQMAEHLPDWLGGGLARRAGSVLSSIPFVSETMRKGQESGARHPWVRMAGNVLPWLAVPGIGEGRLAGLAADTAVGALGGVTQPLDPKDPNYWRDVGLQGALGGVLSGGLGQVTRGGAASRAAEEDRQAAFDAATKAREAAQQTAEKSKTYNEAVDQLNKARTQRYQAAQDAQRQQTYTQRVAAQTAKQAQEAVPHQVTTEWWREALTPIGEQARAPAAGPEASAQVRSIVGDRLNQIRGRMRIDRNDAGFRAEIDKIRNQTDSELATDAMRNKWHYEPEVKFDKDGNPLPPSQSEVTKQRGSDWSRYVEQPLENLPELSGRQMADYVSRLGDLAEKYARDAARAPQEQRPELEAISRGLRRVVDAVDAHGSAADPALRTQLTAAKRSYHLWSIGNQSVDAAGIATPRRLIDTWTRRQGGRANYGAEMHAGHPNARLKQGLEQARAAHETGPPPVTPAAPLRRPGQWSGVPVPKVPPVPVKARPPLPSRTRQAFGRVGELAAHLPGAMIGLKAGSMVGHPYWGAGVGAAASKAMAPAVRSTAEQAGKLPGVVGAMGGRSIPEIVVRPSRDNQENQ